MLSPSIGPTVERLQSDPMVACDDGEIVDGNVEHRGYAMMKALGDTFGFLADRKACNPC